MNALELSEALGALPQEMIDTALGEQVPGRTAHSSPILSHITTIIAAAACLVLAVGSVSLIAVLRNRRDNPQNPAYTTAAETGTDLTAESVPEIPGSIPFQVFAQFDHITDSGNPIYVRKGWEQLKSAVIRSNDELQALQEAIGTDTQFPPERFAESALVFVHQHIVGNRGTALPVITGVTALTEETGPPRDIVTVSAVLETDEKLIPAAERNWFCFLEVQASHVKPSSTDAESYVRVNLSTTSSETDPVQNDETVISVTGRVVSTDESGNVLSGQSWPLRTTAAGERRETTAETEENPEETTIDPNDHGSKPTGTKSTDAQTTETQTTEPMSKELPYRCRYQFCQWTSDWRDEFDEITMQGKWYTLGLNKLIRSYDEFKGIGLNTDYMDYTPEFFQNHALIFCFAEFSEIGSRPEINSVTLQKRDETSGMYDITVTAARTAGMEAAMQRWLCFLEVDNGDLGRLKDREWYYATVQVDIFHRQASDDSFLRSAKSGSYFKWFDHFQDSGGVYAYTHSELKASDSLSVRREESIITVIRDGKTVFWIGGMPLVSAYFTDLNGDGTNELCVTWGFGSGMYSQGISVYDIKNNIVYTLHERGDYDYTMTEQNGKLIVKRTEFEQHSFLSEDAFCEAGTLRIQNGCLIFTQESGVPDASEVRKEICDELAALPYSERINSYYSDGPQYRLQDGNGLSYLFINWEYVRRTDSGLSAKLPQELSTKIQANGREIGLQQFGVDFGLE